MESSGDDWVAPTAGGAEASWVGEQGLSMRFALTALLFAIVAVSHGLFGRPLTAVAMALPVPLCLVLWRRRKHRSSDEAADFRRGMIVWTAVATYGLWVSVLSTGGTTSPFFVFAIPLIFIAGVHTGPLVAFAVTGGVLACWLFAFAMTRALGAEHADLFGTSSDLEGKLAVLGGAAIALFVGIQNFFLLENAKRRARRRAERSERLVAELRLARDAERVAAARKSHFYAVMSHELRTPLGGLIGLIQALEAMPLGAREREIVANMKASGESLHLIINDVLDLEALERGAIRLEKGAVAIRRKLTEIVQLFAPLADRKQLVLQSEVAENVPPVLEGDPLRVRQILTNLVSNAIKFTNAGSVSLRARWDETTRSLLVTVDDTGTGIASDRLESVFLPFEQNDPTIARRYGGTGLGLAIVKQLVDAMGGTIRVESELGKGTRFVLSIPMAPLAATAGEGQGAAHERPAFPQLAALVVDDDPINRYTSQLLLAQYGVAVATAASGVEALAYLRHTTCDLVFLDLDMPGMSGFELARAIRTDSRVCPRLVALTAATSEDDRRAVREAGIDAFLAKPLDTRALLRLLGEVAEQRVPSLPLPPTNTGSPFDLERVALIREATKHPDVHAALMAQFAASLASQLDALTTACAALDRETIEHVTHKLAGASANLGARRVEAEARKLNASARDPAFAPSESALAPLADAVAQTLSALERMAS